MPGKSILARVAPLWLAVACLAYCRAYATDKPPKGLLPDYSKESYVIEHFAREFTFAADGTWVGEQSAAVRMQSEAGVHEFGVLSFSYLNARQELQIEYVRVRKADGSVVTTPASDAQDISSEVSRTAPMYSDSREKQLPVKALGTGDVLEYKVRFVQKTPEVEGQFWYSQDFLSGAVVLDETLRISVPTDKYVKVASPADKPAVQEAHGQKMYLWSHFQLEPTKPEGAKQEDAPGAKTPAVQLTTFKSWDEVGQWYAQLQNGRMAVTPAIQAKAAELTAGLNTDAAKERAIYNYVSTRFRYISVSLGAGRYQPHSADEVLANQYGDCKDKHTLFASLLKAAGIEAWPVLMGAGLKVDQEVPSPAQFNHVITVLPEANGYVWLDTTPEVAPYGLLQESLLDQKALVIPGNGPARLMTTPAEQPFPRSENVNAKAALKADGTLTAHFDYTSRGAEEMMMRSAFHQTSPAQWRDLVQNIIRTLGFTGEISNVDVDNPEALDRPFHFSYDYTRARYSDWENFRITPPIFPILFSLSADNPKPDQPVTLGGQGEVKYTATLQLPDGFSADIPESKRFQSGFAGYASTYSVANGILFASRDLVITKAKLPVNQWDDYVSFQKKIRKDENQYSQLASSANGAHNPAVINNSEAETLIQQAFQSIQRRDFNTGHDQLTQAERLNPRQRGLWATYAALYIMTNDPSSTMDAFRKELKTYPDSVATYRAFASAQIYYAYKSEAADTLRTLLKLAPGDLEGTLQLSSLLIGEKNYEDVPLLIQKALTAAPDDPRLQAALGEAYLRAGRREEGIAAVRKSTNGSTDPEVFNNAAYLLGDTDTDLPLAQQYAEKAVSMQEERMKEVDFPTLTNGDLQNVEALSALWDTLGWVYFQQGQIDRAEKYVNASWQLSQHGVVGDHLGQIYARQGKRNSAIHVWQLAIAADRSLAGTRERLVKTGAVSTPSAGPTVSAEEELGKLRTIDIPEVMVKEGSAEFFLLFSEGKVSEARFISGPDSLRTAAIALAQASYGLEFPDDGPEKLVRRGILSCSETGKPGCQFTLLLPASTRR
jgi:transglutaminase-like putative cysteine protease/tetratricopeptide (TPR) repeat protein